MSSHIGVIRAARKGGYQLPLVVSTDIVGDVSVTSHNLKPKLCCRSFPRKPETFVSSGICR